jgi:hypothetical protein
MSSNLDDPVLRTAMASFVRAAAALDDLGDGGAEVRDLMDLAETKAVAGLALRKRLTELGWSAPVDQRSAT